LALEKTKQDLEAKRRTIEDDNEYQQDPSDPESTISSLTVSSGTSHQPPGSKAPDDNTNKRQASSSGYDYRKCKIPRNIGENDIDANDISSTSRTSKSKSSCHQSDKGSPSGKTIQQDSNLTEESSKCTSSQTSGDVSSVGAVARGLHCRNHRANHPDIIIRGYTKRAMISEATSMDSSFKLDYEEVFVKSSVPQLLATTAGRIVAWNDMFLKVSGLLASDIDSVTIFSLVRQTELVKLFEIVAATLRSGEMQVVAEPDSNQSSRNVVAPRHRSIEQKDVNATDYTAITLPCTTFHPRNINMKGTVKIPDKLLYMTVTLMTDKDPKKRCFHCVFTDLPGTNGALGSVTPELLTFLYNNQPNVPKDTLTSTII
jgi:hypothetical protein